jgi:hypothetical protein
MKPSSCFSIGDPLFAPKEQCPYRNTGEHDLSCTLCCALAMVLRHVQEIASGELSNHSAPMGCLADMSDPSVRVVEHLPACAPEAIAPVDFLAE